MLREVTIHLTMEEIKEIALLSERKIFNIKVLGDSMGVMVEEEFHRELFLLNSILDKIQTKIN